MINEPLGLPKGSIRAMLVLLITLGAIVSVFLKLDVTDKLIDAIKVIIPLYIGGKMNWDKEKPSEGDNE